MAKRKNNRRSSVQRRDHTPIANHPMLPFALEDIPLTDFEDRRVHAPSFSQPRTFLGPAKITVRRKPKVYQYSLKKKLKHIDTAIQMYSPSPLLKRS